MKPGNVQAVLDGELDRLHQGLPDGVWRKIIILRMGTYYHTKESVEEYIKMAQGHDGTEDHCQA